MRRNPITGDWDENPKRFNVTMFGTEAESAAERLWRGQSVTIDGHLEWGGWEDRDAGGSENAPKGDVVSIVAEKIQLMGESREKRPESLETGLECFHDGPKRLSVVPKS